MQWLPRAFSLAAMIAIASAQVSLAEEDDASGQSDTRTAVLRSLPLKTLRSGIILVAGERLSSFWAEGDTLRPMVHVRKPGTAWRLVRKPDPTANGRLRPDWRLPADLAGTMEMRFSEPALGAPLDSIRVAFAKPAGSPETGPVLDSALESAVNDFHAESNFIPYRSAEGLADLQARLATAEGAAKCLANAAMFRESAGNDARAFAGGLPILVSRVRYHYRDPRTLGLVPGEFRAAGFPVTVLGSGRALLMLDDAYALTNVADPVVRVEVRIGTDTLTVRRNAQREYAFASDGMQTVFLRAFTAKGDSWEQATVVEVPPHAEARMPRPMDAASDGTAPGAQDAPAADAAVDLAIGKTGSRAGLPARN